MHNYVIFLLYLLSLVREKDIYDKTANCYIKILFGHFCLTQFEVSLCLNQSWVESWIYFQKKVNEIMTWKVNDSPDWSQSQKDSSVYFIAPSKHSRQTSSFYVRPEWLKGFERKTAPSCDPVCAETTSIQYVRLPDINGQQRSTVWERLRAISRSQRRSLFIALWKICSCLASVF